MELDRLEARLVRAAAGEGCAIFLVGEAGIGKTRLAHEVLAVARERGFLVLDGRAYPLEGSLAYAPILNAFGRFLLHLDPSRQRTLVSGLPDLGRLFVDLRLSAPEPLSDPALEKTRLFEAVSRLLGRLAREMPVALFLDDLHWADPASIELLYHLTRDLAEQPVVVLGAYRAEGLDAARGLRWLISSLRRAGLAQELAIARLEPAAVAELANGILGGEVPAELLSLLDARAGGTPLFVEGLIRSLLDAGQLVHRDGVWTLGADPSIVLPPDVRYLILERLEGLDLTERHVLDLIAVSGEAVPHDVLRAASGLDDERLIPSLRRLCAFGLIAEEADGPDARYFVTHPLIQEVAYTELPAIARRHAHARYVAALERRRSDDLDRLAYHYHAAGTSVDLDRAVEVLVTAGERAYEVCANDQAVRHLHAAVALIRLGHHPEMLLAVQERLGEARERLGENAAAIAVWTEVLAEQERAENPSAVARLRRRLALAEWDRGHFDVARAHLEAGRRALAGSEPSPALADLLHTRVIILGRLREYNLVSAAAQELVSLAERLDSPRVMAEACLAHFAACLARLDLPGARVWTERALHAAALAGDPLLAQRAHDQTTILTSDLGEHATARQHANLSLTIARRLGARSLELQARYRLAWLEFMAGNWDAVLHARAEFVVLARRLGVARGLAIALGLRALVLTLRGDLAEADACLAEAHQVFGTNGEFDRHVFEELNTAEVVVALERADATGGLAAAERLSGTLLAGKYPPLALAAIGEVQVLAGVIDRALAIANDLQAYAPPDNAYVAALGCRVEGLARQALGQPEAALACLQRSVDAFTAAGVPFDAARARLEWATLVAATEPRRATMAAQESLAAFERIGARRYEKRARQLLVKLGVRPRGSPRSRPRGIPLSVRELEIVRLVAENLTSAEIAEQLVISPRTVTTHLDRIYARLGINSRTALVRYAFEAGLLATTAQPQ